LHYRPSDPAITAGNFFVDYLGVQKLITPNELKTDIDDVVQISSDLTQNILQRCFLNLLKSPTFGNVLLNGKANFPLISSYVWQISPSSLTHALITTRCSMVKRHIHHEQRQRRLKPNKKFSPWL